MTIDTAATLVAAWDAQQTGYIRHRAARFETIARVVADVTRGTDAPRVLDLASGPGSLGRAVRAAVPTARLVLADKDPLLLALASDLHADDSATQIVSVDLQQPGWHRDPLFADPFDAVVSSTALHWLRPDALVATYFALADLVRPGGIVLNGDHLLYDETAEPTLRGLSARDDERVQQESARAGIATWDQWWEAVARTPQYSAALTARESVWGAELHTAPPKVTRGLHVEALRSAGFREAGTVWQYLDDHVVYAIR